MNIPFPARRRLRQVKPVVNDITSTICERITASIQSELANAVRQVESHSNLLAKLNGAVSLPAMRGWPVSPDFAVLMADILDTCAYDCVLEFGSGVSTFILAALLEKEEAYPSIHSHIALEHIQDYQHKTMHLLSRLTSARRSHVWHCPLVDISLTDSVSSNWKFYECTERLHQYFESLEKSIDTLLVVVDGPPGSVGHLARYPAIPLLIQLLPISNLHILLDDYQRADEKSIGQSWIKLLRSRGYLVEYSTPQTEKGALWLKAVYQTP